MRINYIVLALALFFANDFCLARQTGEPADSVWNLFEFDEDSLAFEYELDFYKSLGWFPTPFSNYYNFSIYYNGGYNYSLAHGISSSSWLPTKFLYSQGNPLKDGEGDIKKTFSNENLSSAIKSGYFCIGLDFRRAMPFPAFLRISGEALFTTTLLYSVDNEKHFINWKGERKKIKEVGTIHLYDVSLRGSVGFEFPVYGAYIKMDDDYLCNSYYLYSGFSAARPFYTKGTQFLQIATSKEEIRYINGRDTLRLVSDEKFKTMNPNRYFIDIGIGLDIEATGFGAQFELIASFPTNSILSDAYWGQLLFGFKTSLRIKNFF